jgi:hypothetical protein
MVYATNAVTDTNEQQTFYLTDACSCESGAGVRGSVLDPLSY